MTRQNIIMKKRTIITAIAFLFTLFGIVSPLRSEEKSGSQNNRANPVSVAKEETNSLLASSGPTWLMTIPTADTLGDGWYNLGLIQGGTIPFHADIGGLYDNLEVGIHGVKLRLLREGSPWASFSIGATFGYYPAGAYIVGSKHLRNLRVHLGSRFLPFKFNENNSNMDSGDMTDMSGGDNSIGDDRPVILFGGIEKTIPNLNDARLMLEVGDSVNGGVRFFLTSYLQVDVGVRVGLPERLERKLGKRGTIIGYTSKDTTAYLGISYTSEFKSITSEPK
ncbi:TPA: hypothetical protein EYP66_22865 [Candidatus Poribacteria bacterium]|nr:hypothetical protein [Candidatus Poribacteria bacterium]